MRRLYRPAAYREHAQVGGLAHNLGLVSGELGEHVAAVVVDERVVKSCGAIDVSHIGHHPLQRVVALTPLLSTHVTVVTRHCTEGRTGCNIFTMNALEIWLSHLRAL